MNKFTIIFAICISFLCFKSCINTSNYFFELILSFMGSWNLLNAIILIKDNKY